MINIRNLFMEKRRERRRERRWNKGGTTGKSHTNGIILNVTLNKKHQI